MKLTDLFIILHTTIRILTCRIFRPKISGKLFSMWHPKSHISIRKNGKIMIGKRVTIELGTKLRSTGGKIQIGNNTYINSYCMIVSHDQIVIGNNVSIGPMVCIYDHDHNFKNKEKGSSFISKNIQIGDNVWIGAGVIILKGVQIGNNS